MIRDRASIPCSQESNSVLAFSIRCRRVLHHEVRQTNFVQIGSVDRPPPLLASSSGLVALDELRLAARDRDTSVALLSP